MGRETNYDDVVHTCGNLSKNYSVNCWVYLIYKYTNLLRECIKI
jgi:hypothetical protein